MKERSVPIRPGIEEHLVRGAMSLCEFGIYALIHIQADYRTGIWRGSAPRILATAPRGASLRQIQRAIEHFEEMGYLKSFRLQGARGNTPYLIDKFTVRSGALKGYRVNVAKSESWQRPFYELVTEVVAEDDAVPVAEGVAEHDALSRSKKKEGRRKKENPAAKPAPPADPRHKPVFNSCFEAYRVKYGTEPTWGEREGKSLQTFLRQHAGIAAEEISRRFLNLLASSDRYHAEKHGSLLHLLANFDTFSDGPILAALGKGTNGKPTASDLAMRAAKTSASTDKLIREWLFRFAVEHKEDVAPRLPLWLEAFGRMDPAILESLFKSALNMCRFFPKVSEILEPIHRAEKTAAPEAAEEAWKQVLEIRRLHWNPDIHRRDPNIPTPFERATAALSERIQQAARAAGVFRDFESVEALHTWAKKRFVESFIAYGELEQDQFLLPDGEIKDLLTHAAQAKALPAPSSGWIETRAYGEKYRTQLASQGTPDLSPEERLRVADELAVAARKVLEQSREHVVAVPDETRKALRRQAEIIRQRYPKTGNLAGIPPELRPVEVSA